MRIWRTVPTTTARRVVEGDDTGTVFATDFVFRDASTLIVTLIDSAGDETVQAINTDYTVEGGEGNTGSVIMVVPPASGEILVIQREEPYLQQTDLHGGDPFNAENIETVFDKIVMMIQQLLDTLSRAIMAPLSRDPSLPPLELPEPGSGEILVGRDDESGWDSVDPGTVFGETEPGVVLTIPIGIAVGGTGQTQAATMLRSNYLTATGSGGAYVATSSPAATALVDGMTVRIQANHDADEQPTFNLDGLGAKNMRDAHGALLPNGGTIDTGVYELTYDAGLDSWIIHGLTRPYVSKLSVVRRITSSTNWSKPSNLDYIEVEAEGGGASSGGCAATSSGEAAVAGGGGGGEYAYKRIPAASLSASETVSIGAAGAAPSAGANNGNDGGTTSFGSHVTAAGGKAGAGAAASSSSGNTRNAGGLGGTGGTGGDFHVAGQPGRDGIDMSDESSGSNHTRRIVQTGDGGAGGGPLGGGGGRGGFDGAGTAGKLYGGGGGAPSNMGTESARPGLAGAKGVVIVKEYTFEYV